MDCGANTEKKVSHGEDDLRCQGRGNGQKADCLNLHSING